MARSRKDVMTGAEGTRSVEWRELPMELHENIWGLLWPDEVNEDDIWE